MSNQNTAMKNTARTAKAVATHVVRKKLNLATLKIQLIIAVIIILLLLLAVFIAGIVSIVGGGNESGSSGNINTGQAQVSPEVAQYRGAIFDELSKYGLSEYTELVLALMMQESGGRGNDPMQASESFCGSIGCITDTQTSIEKGILHFKKVLENANYDVNLTLQSYNFGGGFINYVMKNGGSYTKELAISFSQMMYQKVKHTGIYKCHRPSAIQHNACYGDIEYVDAVLKYLPSAFLVDGGSGGAVGNDTYQAILNEMLQYQGRSYVWGGSNPVTGFDCSGLMQWAYAQHGIKLPRTSYEQYKATQQITRDQLQPGDLIFFKSASYNPVTHVGMYVGDGKMYNSANSGVGFASVFTGYWSNIIVGYGRVADFSDV